MAANSSTFGGCYSIVSWPLVLGSLATPQTCGVAEAADQQIPIGRVDLDFADAPAAIVEVDLEKDILADIVNLGEAAIMGSVEALLESAEGSHLTTLQHSAEHVDEIREAVRALATVVHEFHLRVYDNQSAGSEQISPTMFEHFAARLPESDWDNLLRMKDGADRIMVCVARHDDAIRGVFILASDHHDVVVTNVVGELTPDKVKLATHQATKIGIKFGMDDFVQKVLREIERELR